MDIIRLLLIFFHINPFVNPVNLCQYGSKQIMSYNCVMTHIATFWMEHMKLVYRNLEDQACTLKTLYCILNQLTII